MGRILKRVPMDFEYPLNQTWKGYLNPYTSIECKACNGSGLNEATRKLDNDWYTHLRNDGKEGWVHHLEQEDVQALIDAGRLWDFTRVPINAEQREIVKKKVENGENNWLPFNNGYIPTADEVNAWSRIFGHDTTNRMICVKARATRLGVYGECEYCKGEGEIWQSDDIKKLHDEWKQFEPPVGEGYQLWSTTSDSPKSPVFKSLEELCEWCENNATTFGYYKTTKEQWMEMLKEDFVYHAEGNYIFI